MSGSCELLRAAVTEEVAPYDYEESEMDVEESILSLVDDAVLSESPQTNNPQSNWEENLRGRALSERALSE